jgi:hypothetical protein
MKYATRIVVFGRNALFVRYRIFCCTHKILTGTHDSHHREQADGDYKIFSASLSVV